MVIYIDWGTLPKKKRRGRPRKHPKRVAPKEKRSRGRPVGVPPNSAEVRARQSKSIRDSNWRRHSPNNGNTSMQSASGFAGTGDFSVFSRQHHGFRPLSDEWDSYNED